MTARDRQDAYFAFTMGDYDEEVDIESPPRVTQTPGYQASHARSKSDYSLNRRGEGSVDAVVDYSWLDTRGDDFLASTHYKEGQDHQGENAVHQRNNPMVDMWSSCELFMSETINSPSMTRSILASGIESLEGATQARNEDIVSSEHEVVIRYPQVQSNVIPKSNELTQVETASNVVDLTNDASDTSTENDVETVVGSVLSNGRFRCSVQGCHRQSFGRQAELRRHYYGMHTRRLAYWCEIPWCARSKEVGSRPFPRKDKLKNHIQKVHGDMA